MKLYIAIIAIFISFTSFVLADTATLFPTSAGDVTNITHVTGSAFHWSAVDESTADDATSFVEQNGDGTTAHDLYNIENSTTTGTITNVRLYTRGLGTSAWYKGKLKTNSTVYTTAQYNSASFTTQYTDYATNPNTSSAWTWTQIDDLQIGTEMYRHPAEAANVTQVYVLVTYTPDEVAEPDIIATTTDMTYKDWLLVNMVIIFLLMFIPIGVVWSIFKKS